MLSGVIENFFKNPEHDLVFDQLLDKVHNTVHIDSIKNSGISKNYETKALFDQRLTSLTPIDALISKVSN